MASEYDGLSRSFAKFCREADRERHKAARVGRTVPVIDDKSVAWVPPREARVIGAPQATVGAVMYELRTDGVAALKQPNCRRRLGDLSRKQFDEVIARLIKLRGRSYCRGITDELFVALDEIRK